MKIALEISPRMAAAVLSRLLSAEWKHTLELDRPKHYSDVVEFTAALAVALEKEANRAPVVSTAAGSRDEDRKRGRPKKQPDAAPKDGEKKPECTAHVFDFGRCKKCGEPEPRNCANGYHLYQNGKCAHCGKAEDAQVKP